MISALFWGAVGWRDDVAHELMDAFSYRKPTRRDVHRTESPVMTRLSDVTGRHHGRRRVTDRPRKRQRRIECQDDE